MQPSSGRMRAAVTRKACTKALDHLSAIEDCLSGAAQHNRGLISQKDYGSIIAMTEQLRRTICFQAKVS